MTPTYSTLVEDLGRHLAALGVGQWRDDGKYTTFTPPAIYWGTVPDEAVYGIGINVYADDRQRDDTSPTLYVQFRARGDRHPRTPGLMLDKIFQHLHDKTNYQLNNATSVLLSRRHLRTEEERDENQRWTRADSWSFTLNPS